MEKRERAVDNRPNLSEKIYSLVLNQAKNLGPVSFVRLIHHFGSAQKVFEAKPAELENIPGVSQQIIKNLDWAACLSKAEGEIRELEKQSIQVLLFNETGYPERLRQIHAFPPLLYIQGNLESFDDRDWLAVVGSRHPTEYGMVSCRRLTSELVQQGIGIVSGFALGIDIAAQLTAVEQGGKTIGVLGSGLKHAGPSANKRYLEKILEKGALISEFPYSMEARPEYFPRRNRIISGLSRGVLVVEAGEKSGSLITAAYAVDQNRDLFSVPGPVSSPLSVGCHVLIQQGAKLVGKGEDILSEWRYPARNRVEIFPFADSDEEVLYKKCLEGPRTPDQLVEETGLSVSRVTMFLTKLELMGKIQSLSGRKFQSL